MRKTLIQLEQEFYSQIESYEQMFEEEFQTALWGKGQGPRTTGHGYRKTFPWMRKKNFCRKLSFEEAMDKLFRCPTCGKPLQPYDNTKFIEALKWKITQIENYLDQLTKVKKIEEPPPPPPKKKK